jgi:putative hydrolase of the HAD superfamily
MVKAILFDADGVVIKSRAQLFSDRFAEAHGLAISEVLPFFKNDMREAFVGQADIKQSLPSYLHKWHWIRSVDDFLEFWFAAESPRDEEVIAYIDKLRAVGTKCYIATDREKYWAKYLVENVGLGKHFDGFMFSYDIGFEKHDPEYFQEVMKRLGLKPEEVMYWDDDQKNVDVAKGVGIDARLYTDFDKFKDEAKV